MRLLSSHMLHRASQAHKVWVARDPRAGPDQSHPDPVFEDSQRDHPPQWVGHNITPCALVVHEPYMLIFVRYG